MVGQLAHQIAIERDPGEIAQLVDVNIDYDAVLKNQLEEMSCPPFWENDRVVRNKLFKLFEAAPVHSGGGFIPKWAIRQKKLHKTDPRWKSQR
jgi:hypothetical protein